MIFTHSMPISGLEGSVKLDIEPFSGPRPTFNLSSVSETYGSCGFEDAYKPVEARITEIGDCYLKIGGADSGLVFLETGQVILEPSVFTQVCREGANGRSIDLAGAVDLAGDFAMTFDAAWANYYHWVCFALAKARLLADVRPGLRRFLFPAIPDRFAYRGTWTTLLDRAGMSDRSVFLADGLYRVERLTICWTSEGDPTAIVDFPAFIDVLRRFKGGAPSEDPSRSGVGGRFYIARKSNVDARLDARFETSLDAMCASFDVKKVFLEDLTIERQIELLDGAGLIVSPHGAGLTNMIFARRDCRIVELNRWTDGQFRPWFYQLASGLGLPYQSFDANDGDRALSGVEAILSDLHAPP